MKEYLGDGAYAEYDGYNFKLTAENGITITDRVTLEPEVLKNFIEFILKHVTIKLKAGTLGCNET